MKCKHLYEQVVGKDGLPVINKHSFEKKSFWCVVFCTKRMNMKNKRPWWWKRKYDMALALLELREINLKWQKVKRNEKRINI